MLKRFLGRLFKSTVTAPQTEIKDRLGEVSAKPVENPARCLEIESAAESLPNLEKHDPKQVLPVRLDPWPEGVQKWVGWNFCGWIRVSGVTSYRINAEFAARHCVENTILKLVREPGNSHDPNAVMVCFSSKLFGYVDRQTARTLSEKFQTGMPIRALFKRGYVGDSGAIAIDILPQMPSAKERRQSGWEL